MADVILRWTGNINPEHDTEHISVGAFYDAHNTIIHCDLYFGKVPTAMRHNKGRFMLLELLIDINVVCCSEKPPDF